MKLLRACELTPDRRDIVVRHGRIGPLVLFVMFATPGCLFIPLGYSAGSIVKGLPWPLWIVGPPIALLVVALWLLALHCTGQMVRRSFAPTNWLLRVTGPALYVNLRSYQNGNFPDDAPTIARIEFGEIGATRRAVERWTESGVDERSTRSRRWLEFELSGVDTTELAAAVEHERERPGPETSFLGIRGSSRFQHVTAFVPSPGRLRVLDLGRRMRRALAKHVRIAERREEQLDGLQDGNLDARLRALIARGDTLDATALVRQEMNVSLTEAKQFVDALRRAA